MSLAHSRRALRPIVAGLKDFVTHNEIETVWSSLGQPTPNREGSKAERILGSFDSLPANELIAVTESLSEQRPRQQIL